VLAAVAACRAQRLPLHTVAASLQTFYPNQHNAGRMNFYKASNGFILLDYGHNAAAFETICRAVHPWRRGRVIGIIGVPGDRADSLVSAAGQAAADGFDHIVIREDRDLRGRSPGEIPTRLRDAILSHAPERPCTIVPDIGEAIDFALKSLRENDLVVVFYEELAEAHYHLSRCGAVPIQNDIRVSADESWEGTPVAAVLTDR
jgi:cyanophycin synthetase